MRKSKKNFSIDEIERLRNELGSYNQVAKYFDVSSKTIYNYRKNKSQLKYDLDKNRIYSLKNIKEELKKFNPDVVAKKIGMNENALKIYTECLEANAKYAKNEQKYRDVSNAKGKHFREYVRIENTLEELSTSILETLQNTKFNNNIPKQEWDENNEMVGVIHWSDLHFNEYVDLETNQYNWTVASKRIKKHLTYCIKIFKCFGIKKVFIAGTGDFLNSDRRLDELLINCDNRAKAVVLAYDLLRQAILELSKHFMVDGAFVCGNESRLDLDINNARKLVSNNFDYTIAMMLSAYFKNCKNVNIFLPDNPEECVVNILGKNVLLLHGHKGISSDIETSISRICSKIGKSKNCTIDYVLFGHIHSAYISDNFARSGSLTGDNEYSYNKLQLISKASQNCYIFSKKDIHCFRIDLQNTDGINGYKFDNSIETYNSKSKEKCNEYKEIIKVVI